MLRRRTHAIPLERERNGRLRVVILGSGWSGYKALRDLSPKRYQLIVISPRSYFCFTPLLASTSVGTLEYRCAMEPIRRRQGTQLYEAWADRIDFKEKSVSCSAKAGGSFDLTYDKLLISVGCYVQTFGIKGVKEYAYFLKDVPDARRIRTRILESFEQAVLPTATDEVRRKLLHFVIVGGGPTGVEFAAELNDLVQQDLVTLYPSLIPFVKITLIDVAKRILGTFDEKLAAYATAKFEREGVQLLTSEQIMEVRSSGVVTKEHGCIDCTMVVWSTGLAMNPFVEGMLGVKKDPKAHRLVTTDHLQVIDDTGCVIPEVFATGDCAVIEGSELPATAQVANQKGAYVAKYLNSSGSIPSFKFHNRGTMASLGNYDAIIESKTDLTGRIAWFMWRAAYFSMSVSIRNKILIPIYWFLNFIFGRDISRF